VSGWIKVEKDLREDVRVRRIARILVERGSVTHQRYTSQLAVTLVLGALNQLWMHADTFARDDDTLEMTTDEIDELTGIEGFAQLLPTDWLKILDANSVELPGFQEHNGSEAKRRAQTAKRVGKHRRAQPNAKALQPSSECNASALPDQTRLDQKRPDQKEREARAHEATRGTVIDVGSNLTRLSASEALSSLLDDWRRDVPECNPEAFARWIVHVELSGKPMNPAMRLGQARRLAGNGDFAAQAEVVDFCCENGYRTLMPITDVRARTQGMARPNGMAKKPYVPPITAEEAEARERAREAG
jgi:hypothetical protein